MGYIEIMNKKYFIILNLVGLMFAISSLNAKEATVNSTLIDLTYPFNQNTLYWPTEAPLVKKVEFYGMTEKGYFYSANRLDMAEHGGTHLDAPIHFNKEGCSVESIPLEDLMGPALLVDVSERALKNRDYLVSVNDFQSFEKKYGSIPQASIVLLKTGQGKYWPDAEKYLGTKQKGPEAVKQLHFPGLSPEAARWLVEQRKIKAVGIDTASIDYGQSSEFLTHRILAEHQVPIFENLAQLDKLPVKDFEIIALPMKIEGGSGGPLRIIARIPKYQP